MFAIYAKHLFAGLISLAVLSVLFFSDVNPSLGAGVDSELLNAAALTYGIAMAYWTIWPDHGHRIHIFAGTLGAGVVAARIGGFVELAIERESWALTGAVFERLIILFVVIRWHLARITEYVPRNSS